MSLRTRASGFCHTDIDILTDQYGDGNYPLVPGNEYADAVEPTEWPSIRRR